MDLNPAKERLKSTYLSFEDSLKTLLEMAKKGPISIQTFLTILSGRGKMLLLISLSLGFGQIPVIVIFLGFFIAYLGLRIALGHCTILLPKWILRKKLSSFLLTKVIGQILGFLNFLKKWSHPRNNGVRKNQAAARIISGILIFIIGLCLSTCPPIPFVSWIACGAIFTISIGLLNDDDLYVKIGGSLTGLYLIVVLLLVKYASIGQMIEWIKEIFN